MAASTAIAAPAAALRADFRQRYGRTPLVVRAPGRVNLIGEHTDYNDGFVMPAALAMYTTVAAAANAARRVRVHSRTLAQSVELPLEAGAPRVAGERGHWAGYVQGVVHVLAAHGVPLVGADLLVDSSVPLGAGLSSSASLELAVARALLEVADLRVPALELARLCQRAENEVVGTRCGIMDQFAAACGRAGCALLLDCRTLEHRALPVDSAAATTDAVLVICNSMVRHALAGGEYNRRREQCEAGVRALARRVPGIAALRDVSHGVLEDHREALDPVVWRRCRHVVSENTRVIAAAAALESGDAVRVGNLMRASHASLRDDFAVSCEELDLLVQLAVAVEGVYGARMTGGGFGGCTVNLVRRDAVERFRAQVGPAYQRATGRAPEIYACATADGATRLADE